MNRVVHVSHPDSFLTFINLCDSKTFRIFATSNKKTSKHMRAYKGFIRSEDGTLSCRGFVYEPGKTYKHEGKIKICWRGFHACHELWQTWPYYPNNGKNVFYEVDCVGKIIESEDSDGKFVCSEIKLVKEIDVTEVARFDEAWSFFGGFAAVKLNGKWNFINTEGEILSKRWFDDTWRFSEGFAVVELDGKRNFINTKGEILSEQWFDNAWNFSEGIASVKLNGKYNFINTEGELLSEQWFDDACSFSEGFAVVELDGKYNFISTEGKMLSKRWFDNACSFSEGFAMVKLGGKWMKINTKGEIVQKTLV